MKRITVIIFLSVLGICLGAGGTQASKAEAEVDTSSIESVKRMFIGYPLTLLCNMTSTENISLHLDWFKNGTKLEDSDRLKIHQHNSSLVIHKAEIDDVGVYRCEVANETLSGKPHPITISVIYFDVSRRMPKSVSVTDQEVLELECPVEGRPNLTVVWHKDDKPIAEAFNSTRVSLDQNSFGVPDGKFIIHKVETIDRGNYSCTITTPIKVYDKFTFVRVKDMYAALWPFLGIVVEVLLLGIIIFIFEKRRAKAEFEESDTDQGNDQKNTADHNKDSVRQRK